MGLARAEPAVASNSARGDQGDEAAVKWNAGRRRFLAHGIGNIGLLHEFKHVAKGLLKRIHKLPWLLGPQRHRQPKPRNPKNQHAAHGSRH